MESTIDTVVFQVVPAVLALAVLIFFWGLSMYLFNSGDKEVRGIAESIMFWGTMVAVVTTAVWAVIRAF